MEKFTWKNQNECLSLMLKDLATSGNFADVTLVLDDKSQIKSHKVILAAVIIIICVYLGESYLIYIRRDK